ncbi:MAG: D-tyrosyl-tRNA(Tyr) deacylase [Desulfobacterales bacterium]|nr:D-tyrosyl-tRNA(Tyr) deacylase [Desulfobacterales bacterium]
MRAVIQRVSRGEVSVEGETVGRIDAGLVVLLGVADGDTPADADYLADKTVHLRIFEDDNGKMNRSLLETEGQILVVSQFTLLGDCKKGRRPSFVGAARPDLARALYRHFVDRVAAAGIVTATGRFQATMTVSLVNDGPVTLILESPGSGS